MSGSLAPILGWLQRCAVWIALVLPSLWVVQKYLGGPVTVAYGLAAALGVAFAPRVPRPRSGRTTFYLALLTLAIVTALFIAIYPRVNVHTPHAGSDDDDAYNIGARALWALQSPYVERTYLGNALHQLPGSFVLAAPFVLLGTSAWQNFFWIPLFFLVVKAETGDGAGALGLGWLTLFFSPAVAHQILTGTGHAANTIAVLLGLWWLTRTRHRGLAAVAWGVTLASRANFLFLIPLACGWLRRRDGTQAAIAAGLLTCGTVAALSLPFYFHDPANFGPLEAANRLTRFDTLFPHAGMTILMAMGVLTIALSFRPMDRTGLFWSCALVQAFPVFLGTLLTLWWQGDTTFEYAGYATFFGWFVLMAAAPSFWASETPKTT